MMENMHINKALDKLFNESELLDIAMSMIRTDSSTICPERENNLARYLLNLFQKEGISCYFQPVTGGRGNIIAILKGKGTGKSLMFNGHMDTVPAGTMKNAFYPTLKNGILWGRGAADMKGGLAAMVYAMILLHRSDISLDGDVVFSGVIDEEAAKSSGSRYIADYGPKTDYAIVGEPTGLHLVTAHKGIDYFAIHFTGKAAHSSVPENGINAIYAASEYVLKLKNYLVPNYQKKIHPLLGNPVINPGVISGCAKANDPFLHGESETFAGIVPDNCSLWIDIRWIPGQNIKQIIDDLSNLGVSIQSQYPGLSIKVEYIPLPRPAMEIPINDPFTILVSDIVRSYDPDAGDVQGGSYFADSGILYGIGKINSIVLGPGDIQYAHSEEEHVPFKQILNAAKIYFKTAARLCGKCCER